MMAADLEGYFLNCFIGGHLLDVTIIMDDGATELSGIAIEFDQVLGWRLL
jgi:hypothetical protein